mgnify:CR=1 FL=1
MNIRCITSMLCALTVFGGNTPGTSTFLGTTFELQDDGTGLNWVQINSVGPGARAGVQMVTDSLRGRVVLFGGANAGREVIYFNGRNENKLLAHEGSGFKSFFGTIGATPAACPSWPSMWSKASQQATACVPSPSCEQSHDAKKSDRMPRRTVKPRSCGL